MMKTNDIWRPVDRDAVIWLLHLTKFLWMCNFKANLLELLPVQKQSEKKKNINKCSGDLAPKWSHWATKIQAIKTEY